MKDNTSKKWYQKPYWLIGLGILCIGSLIHSDSIDRLLIIVFFITAVLIFVWLYFLLRPKEQNHRPLLNFFNAFFTLILALMIGSVLIAIIYGSLSWIKCGEKVFETQNIDSQHWSSQYSQSYKYCDIFGSR